MAVTHAGRRADGAGAGTADGPAGADRPTNVFRVVEVNATLTFNERGGLVESIGLVQGPANLTLARVTADAAPRGRAAAAAAATASSRLPPTVARATGPRNWPSFRGDGSAGNGDGQRAVTEWDVATGKNIKWKTPIPGVATSSPIVWGNRVFATTAISKAGDNSFKTGLYGDVKPVDDLSPHEWKIYSLDKATGKILWERTAFTGAPKTKRHTKSSQASSTPATDGRRVVARVRIGGPADRVGLQRQGAVARRPRHARQRMVLRSGVPVGPLELADHLSQLGDPAGRRAEGLVHRGVGSRHRQTAVEDRARRRDLHLGHADDCAHADGRDELVTNGTKIRGYDPATGKLLWTLGPELGDHDRHAGRRQRARLRHRRLPAGAADLRDPARRRAATSRCRRDRSRARRSRGAT